MGPTKRGAPPRRMPPAAHRATRRHRRQGGQQVHSAHCQHCRHHPRLRAFFVHISYGSFRPFSLEEGGKEGNQITSKPRVTFHVKFIAESEKEIVIKKGANSSNTLKAGAGTKSTRFSKTLALPSSLLYSKESFQVRIIFKP